MESLITQLKLYCSSYIHKSSLAIFAEGVEARVHKTYYKTLRFRYDLDMKFGDCPLKPHNLTQDPPMKLKAAAPVEKKDEEDPRLQQLRQANAKLSCKVELLASMVAMKDELLSASEERFNARRTVPEKSTNTIESGLRAKHRRGAYDPWRSRKLERSSKSDAIRRIDPGE